MADIYKHTRPEFKQGDTIPELPFTFTVDEGIDLTGATVRMQVYWNGSKRIDVSSETSGITINNALKFTIDKRDYTEVILPVGIGIGDIEITFSDGTRETYFDIVYQIIKHETV